jgi:hypothetical protein
MGSQYRNDREVEDVPDFVLRKFRLEKVKYEDVKLSAHIVEALCLRKKSHLHMGLIKG